MVKHQIKACKNDAAVFVVPRPLLFPSICELQLYILEAPPRWMGCTFGASGTVDCLLCPRDCCRGLTFGLDLPCEPFEFVFINAGNKYDIK